MGTILKKIVVFLLTLEARLVLWRYKPNIIAISGNVGKTSTKDAVYSVLAETKHARKSEKSFNSEIGVPLTILALPNAWQSVMGWLENLAEGAHLVLFGGTYPEWLVLETGADRPGDLRKLAWLRPAIVVYTRFPDVPVHVEFFEGPEQVIEEKLELLKALRSDGTLIVNADDPKMEHLPLLPQQKRLSYGTGEHATVRGYDVGILYEGAKPVGVSCSVRFQAEEARLEVRGALGTHHILPLLAGIAVAISEGVSFIHAVEAAKKYQPPLGRMRVLPGISGTTLIDDTYNASPAAVAAGLQTLQDVKVMGRRIAVLGDMLELGDYSMQEHTRVGELVSDVADVFVAVGVRMREAARVAEEKGKARGMKVHTTQDAAEASFLLKEIMHDGDVVYLKGSQAIRMERAVHALMAEPERASELLVRQDAEWKKR